MSVLGRIAYSRTHSSSSTLSVEDIDSRTVIYSTPSRTIVCSRLADSAKNGEKREESKGKKRVDEEKDRNEGLKEKEREREKLAREMAQRVWNGPW